MMSRTRHANSKDTGSSRSSKRWLREHFDDVFVKRAHQEGLRARSAYKLIEINERYKIIKPNMTVVDLGAAPGSWTEYAAKIVGDKGKVIALDILPFNAVKNTANVTYLQRDFTDEKTISELLQVVGAHNVDTVISDMAPNTSGIKAVDQARSLELVYTAGRFACATLKAKGTFLAKAFQSQDLTVFVKKLRISFCDVKIIKPDASRARSWEIFLLASGFRMITMI